MGICFTWGDVERIFWKSSISSDNLKGVRSPTGEKSNKNHCGSRGNHMCKSPEARKSLD